MNILKFAGYWLLMWLVYFIYTSIDKYISKEVIDYNHKIFNMLLAFALVTILILVNLKKE